MVILLLMLLFLISGSILAQQEIMPLTEINAGMRGIGKTVISGTTIEEFDVDILGVLTNRSQVGDLILVKVSGPLIEKTGGIAGGMSGSPVYIDGKLIGAIGYGWGLTDHRLGMITPIETMLKVLEMDQLGKASAVPLRLNSTPMEPEQNQNADGEQDVSDQAYLPVEIQLENRRIQQVAFCGSYKEALRYKSAEDTLVAYPAQTPLLVNGLSGRALDRLMTDLKDFDLIPVETGGSLASAQSTTAIEPGGAISVQLVRGDIDISAIGTLTYRKDNEILGFGHPFLGLGPVELYLSGAEILTVIDHLEMPFKLGVPTEPIGIITQDRNAAIGGRVGLSPKIIPVNITVHDLDLAIEQEVQFQVVRDEGLLVPLTINSILQSIDNVMDRQGYGTSTLKLQIMGDKLPNHIFDYSNMYYSSSDIAARTLYDLYNILNMVVTNPFEKVNIVSIHSDIQVVRKRQIAIIEEVKLLNTDIYPGQTAQVEVTLRPYRAEPFKQIIKVPIPENIQTGDASLTVSGGYYGAYQTVDVSLDQTGETIPQDHVVGGHYKDIKDVLNNYKKDPKNNELVIEILPYYIDVMESEMMGMKEEGSEIETVAAEQADSSENTDTSRTEESTSVSEESLEVTDQKKEQSVKKLFPTDYVLEGSLTLEITILETAPVESTESIENEEPQQPEGSENYKEKSDLDQPRPARRGNSI